MFFWPGHLKGVPRTHGVAVAVGDEVYSFGGYIRPKEGEDQIRVHIFNTLSLSWRTLPPVVTGREECRFEVPPMRWRFTAVLIEDFVYIWGGRCNKMEFCSELYAFDVINHRWLKPNVSGTVPEDRRGHSACALGNLMYVCGGEGERVYFKDNLYMLDTTTMVWSLIMTPPALKATNIIAIGTKLFVSGREFDPKTNYWQDTPLPQLPGCGHGAFVYKGELCILGRSSNGDINELWKFKQETFSWKKFDLKRKVSWPSDWVLKCCTVGDRIVIIGGEPWKDKYIHILELCPSLKTLCKLAVIECSLEKSELPHNIRWELAAMTFITATEN